MNADPDEAHGCLITNWLATVTAAVPATALRSIDSRRVSEATLGSSSSSLVSANGGQPMAADEGETAAMLGRPRVEEQRI
jgi:hypothetical protein